MNNCCDFSPMMCSLQNVNAQVCGYFNVDEESLVVGGQGECRKGKAKILAGNDEQQVIHVAIKRLKYAFESALEAKYAYRELALLGMVRHPNLIHLFDVLIPIGVDLSMATTGQNSNNRQNMSEFTQIHLVTIDGGETLSTLMRRQNLLKQRWPLAQIRSIIFQLLSGLDYLHKAGIVHRDLKVNNIVMNEQGLVKILDFGCGRLLSGDDKMTPIQMVPYYRPPEIFLGINSYDFKVDIWSVGCIFAELILGRRLFNGADFERQWPKFVQLLGMPDLDSCYSPVVISQIRPSYLEYIHRLGNCNNVKANAEEPMETWRQIIPDELFSNDGLTIGSVIFDAENARDLLSKMLQFDSAKRISAYVAIKHPFFDEIRPAEEYPTNGTEQQQQRSVGGYHCCSCHSDSDNEMEEAATSIEQWKEKILHEINHFASGCVPFCVSKDK